MGQAGGAAVRILSVRTDHVRDRFARTQRHAYRRRHRRRDERQSVPLRNLHPYTRGHSRSRCHPEGLTMTTDLDLTDAVRPSRRTFLKAAGAVAAFGLTIGFEWAGTGRRALAATTMPDATFAPNAFLRVAPDNSVTVIAKHVEMGQGAYTGIATIVAEELDANWQDVRVESAPADAKRYAHLAFGTVQGSGGSSAMANSWMQLREAGAKARAMLISAAAAQWQVPASELTARDGSVHHAATNRTATYGSLASAAARLPVPGKVALKSPTDLRWIGHQ